MWGLIASAQNVRFFEKLTGFAECPHMLTHFLKDRSILILDNDLHFIYEDASEYLSEITDRSTRNESLKTLLRASVSNEFLHHFTSDEEPRILFEKFKKALGGSSELSIRKVINELDAIRIHRLDTYLDKIQQKLSELSSLGGDRDSSEVRHIILKNLPAKYSDDRRRCTGSSSDDIISYLREIDQQDSIFKPAPKVDTLRSFANRNKSKVEKSGFDLAPASAIDLIADMPLEVLCLAAGAKQPIRCLKCGGFNHKQIDCPSPFRCCFTCGKSGHIAADCSMKAFILHEGAVYSDIQYASDSPVGALAAQDEEVESVWNPFATVFDAEENFDYIGNVAINVEGHTDIEGHIDSKNTCPTDFQLISIAFVFIMNLLAIIYNSVFKMTQKFNSVNALKVSHVGCNCRFGEKCLRLVVDSGASKHMMSNKGLLKNLKSIASSTIKSAFGHKSIISLAGTLSCLTLRNMEFNFGNALVCDQMNEFRLLSVHELAKDNFTVLFKGDDCFISKNDEIVCQAAFENGAYILHASSDYSKKQPVCSLATMNEDDSHLLNHIRWGHINSDYVKQIGISSKLDRFCPPCAAAKLVKFPTKKNIDKHSTTTFIANKFGEKLYVDTVGPFPEALNGEKYAVTIVDSFTKYVWSRIFKSKADIAVQLIGFIKSLEKNGNVVKCLHSDQGSEFVNHTLWSYLQRTGIKVELSTPYQPSENGLPERFHRTLVSTSKALLKSADLPEKFWGYAMKHSALLWNLVPRRHETQSPHQKISDQAPELDRIRIFGAICYTKNNHPPNYQRLILVYILASVMYAKAISYIFRNLTKSERCATSRSMNFHSSRISN